MRNGKRENAAAQGSLFTVPGRDAPDLAGYDVILVNISGGKDSQAALDETVRAADAAGVRDRRIVTVFCDLGDEDEWPGTRELAAGHAAHYGLRHEVVCREITTGPRSAVFTLWASEQAGVANPVRSWMVTGGPFSPDRLVVEGTPAGVRRADVKWLTPQAFRLWCDLGPAWLHCRWPAR